MAKGYSRADVRTHWEGYAGDALPAVNVKVRGTLEDGFRELARAESLPEGFTVEWIVEEVSDDLADGTFWEVCRRGFEQMQAEAREIFGAGVEVYAEGRSGGWAVVTGLPELEEWDAVQLGRWRRFERFARGLADGAMAEVVRVLLFDVWEWRRAEAEERERAANQEVATR